MKIAIDVRSLMEGRHSGVEEYTIELIRAMVRGAPQHEYHLFYNSLRPVRLPDFASPRVSIHGWRFPNKIFNLLQFGLGQPHWDRLVSADCFFIPNIRLAPVAAATPLVATAHDLSFARFPSLYSWRRRLWHQLMRPALLLHNADRVIAVSEATARDLREIYHIPAEKIQVIYSGAAVPAGDTALSAIRITYHLPEKFVLYLGTLEPRKNIPSIIAAFSAIADSVPHDLVIAGTPGWLTGEIESAIAASPARERIHRIGFVAPEDKAALLGAASLFVYPSFYEGFGFPPLEALLCGTPVITSCNSSLPEVVGEWATLIDPYDPAELALTMQEMLEHPSPVTEATKAAVRERFNWERAAQQTLAVLQSVV